LKEALIMMEGNIIRFITRKNPDEAAEK